MKDDPTSSPVTYAVPLNSAARLLNLFRSIDPEMQMQTALTFLVVALDEGIRQFDIMEKLGIGKSSVSRNCASLSDLNRRGRPGHGLIYMVDDTEDRRFRRCYLTPKGKRFKKLLEEV